MKHLILKDILKYYSKKDISQIQSNRIKFCTTFFYADTIVNTLEGYHKDILISRKLLITNSEKKYF